MILKYSELDNFFYSQSSALPSFQANNSQRIRQSHIYLYIYQLSVHEGIIRTHENEKKRGSKEEEIHHQFTAPSNQKLRVCLSQIPFILFIKPLG
jgi:hypothetical protein